ncbi:Uncharacterised protein [uncultured archaeon]|nr:Uncharacterised protein [uncultured archaeon]
MSSTENKKITSMFVLEVLGRPPEYLIETLNDLVKKIGEEKGVLIKNVKINEPVLMKDQKDFYTSFAEIELETENLLYLSILMFKYMPAYIEIISPQNISLTNAEFGDILNELTRRLHGYDEIVRIMQNEKSILENRLREVIEMKQEKDSQSSVQPSKNVEKKKDKKRKKENEFFTHPPKVK